MNDSDALIYRLAAGKVLATVCLRNRSETADSTSAVELNRRRFSDIEWTQHKEVVLRQVEILQWMI